MSYLYLCIRMKILKSILAIFLTATILVSSSGVVLAAHTCFKKSETHVSLYAHNGCCSSQSKSCHDKPYQGLQAKCCDLKIIYQKISVNTFFSHSVKIPSIYSINLESFTGLLFTEIIRVSVPDCFLLRGPDLFGTSLLHSISLLLI
ncbi:MAG: hypothetical protein IT242_08800 [Bacteroidia bacterium]|nr:hypothetical protein [Bacteroidia bacterium]